MNSVSLDVLEEYYSVFTKIILFKSQSMYLRYIETQLKNNYRRIIQF